MSRPRREWKFAAEDAAQKAEGWSLRERLEWRIHQMAQATEVDLGKHIAQFPELEAAIAVPGFEPFLVGGEAGAKAIFADEISLELIGGLASTVGEEPVVASFKRTLRLGDRERWAYHDACEVKPEFRGHGISLKLLSNCLKLYDELELEEARVQLSNVVDDARENRQAARELANHRSKIGGRAEREEHRALDLMAVAADRRAEGETARARAELQVERSPRQLAIELAAGAVTLAVLPPVLNGAIDNVGLLHGGILVVVALVAAVVGLVAYVATDRFAWFGVVAFLTLLDPDAARRRAVALTRELCRQEVTEAANKGEAAAGSPKPACSERQLATLPALLD